MECPEHEATSLPDSRPETATAAGASVTSPTSNDKLDENSVDIKIPRITSVSVTSWDSRHETLPWNPLRMTAPPRSLGSDPYAGFLGRSQAQRFSHMDRVNDLSSGKSHTDEGYHSISGGSHSDGRSVFSSDTSQRFTARIPLLDLLGYQPVDSDLPGTIVDYATQPQQKPSSFECREEGCDYEGGTQSDLKKHAARHTVEHVCKVPGCARTDRFETLSNLERHQMSVHNIRPEHGQSRQYKCFGQNCSKAEKVWPRFDNFKQHLKRVHTDEDMEILISKSNVWSDNLKVTKSSPPVLKVEDGLGITTPSRGSDEFHVYPMGRYAHPGHPDHPDWKSPFPAPILASSERMMLSLLSDDKPQYHSSKQTLLRPGSGWATPVPKDSGSEYETRISSLRPPMFGNSPRSARVPSVPFFQSGLEEFDNVANPNPPEVLLPTTSRRDLYFSHLWGNENFPLLHQNKFPQSQIEPRSHQGQMRLEAPRRDHHNEPTDSSANSSKTLEDALLDEHNDHESSEGSAAETRSDISTSWYVSEDEQGAELPAELIPIRTTFLEQLIAGYISDRRSCHGHIRSRPCQRETNSGRERHQPSESSRKSAPSAKSLGKRRRESQQDPDELPSSDDDNKRRRINGKSDDLLSRLFACPYAKYDPTRYSERNEIETNYRGCSSKLLRNIARIKQHLYRVHMQPEHYCPRCGVEFDRRDSLIAHSRETNLCEIRELPFKEKMTTDQRNAVHKRTPGKSASKVWYEIFGILFPHAQVPHSPYAESGSPEAVHDFLVYFQERAPQMLSALILQNTLPLGHYEQSMLDLAVEMAIPRLVQEFGIEFHRQSEDIPQALNNSGLVAEAPMAVSTFAEQVDLTMPQTEASPSLTEHTGIGPATFGLDNQQLAEPLVGIPEWYYHQQYTVDNGDYSQNLGGSMFAGSNNWNSVLQGQMPTPVATRQHGTWNQSPGQRLQRVVDGA